MVLYVMFLRDVACQKLLNSANVSRSYSQNNTGTVFFWDTVYIIGTGNTNSGEYLLYATPSTSYSIPTYVITVLKRHGRTDGQTTDTVGQTICSLITALCVASRGKNLSDRIRNIHAHMYSCTRSDNCLNWPLVVNLYSAQTNRQNPRPRQPHLPLMRE